MMFLEAASVFTIGASSIHPFSGSSEMAWLWGRAVHASAEARANNEREEVNGRITSEIEVSAEMLASRACISAVATAVLDSDSYCSRKSTWTECTTVAKAEAISKLGNEDATMSLTVPP